MARYDQDAAFTVPFFSMPDLNPRTTPAPGSTGGGNGPIAPQGVDPGTLTGLPGVGSVVRIDQSDGGANAGVTSDVLPGVQKEMHVNSYTGQTGADDSGAGEGNVISPHHVNSNGLPR